MKALDKELFDTPSKLQALVMKFTSLKPRKFLMKKENERERQYQS